MGDSRNSLQVANLFLRSQPWVAIFCKAPPPWTNENLFNEHRKEMIRVVECLQGTHGLASAQECQWALHPPENTEGFVSGKIWIIARVGETSDVTEVAKQRLKASVSAEAAQTKYCELAGSAAVDLLRQTNATLNNGRGPTRVEYINAAITFLEKEGQNNQLQGKWFTAACNVTLADGSKQVCRLKQTCTLTGAARKYITTITDVFLLNYAVGLDVARVETEMNTQGGWPCKLPLDSLSLQRLAKSPDLKPDLRKMTRRHTVAR